MPSYMYMHMHIGGVWERVEGIVGDCYVSKKIYIVDSIGETVVLVTGTLQKHQLSSLQTV